MKKFNKKKMLWQIIIIINKNNNTKLNIGINKLIHLLSLILNSCFECDFYLNAFNYQEHAFKFTKVTRDF